MVRKRWEHFPHEADVGVRGIGSSREEAFEQVAIALTAEITDPQIVTPDLFVQVSCEAADDELLLVDWLNALIYEMATHNLLFSRFEVRLADGRLEAKAWGERVDRAKHRPAVEAKGATYTALQVRQMEDKTWVAQCVVDV